MVSASVSARAKWGPAASSKRQRLPVMSPFETGHGIKSRVSCPCMTASECKRGVTFKPRQHRRTGIEGKAPVHMAVDLVADPHDSK